MAEEPNRCASCFEPPGGPSPCPHCGWALGDEPESPLFLVPSTRLRERYLIGQVLGHGGFGITYLAWDETFVTKAAIKEYLPRDVAMRAPNRRTVSAYSGEAAEAFRVGLKGFLEEARTLARFRDQPCVIPVGDYFEANNTAYLVMPYLDGMTLRDYLEQNGGRLAYPLAEQILIRVLDGLRPLHATGVLHRDISPDNIYLTAGQQVRLIDFGSARHFLAGHTQTLSAICKAGYSPEEQYRREGKQGPWTDIYAVAATFYRALTGNKPPDALDRLRPSESVNGGVDPLAPPSGQGVEMPPHAERALLQALAVRAGDRFPDVETFQRALRAAEQHPLSWPWRRVLLGASLLLGGSLILYLTFFLNWSSELQKPSREGYQGMDNSVAGDAGIQEYPGASVAVETKKLGAAGKGRSTDEAGVSKYVNLARRESQYIGARIARNEGADRPQGLTVWREGEGHAEMGIGHFVWYPKGREGPYQETFPDLLRYLASRSVRSPDWLGSKLDCPWESRDAFLADIDSPRMRELRSMLAKTKALQVEFMIQRLERALPTILSAINSDIERAAIRAEFERVAIDTAGDVSAAGVFALLDYVHFKGEGDNPSERYKGQGWGLLQVLQEMHRRPSSENAVWDFASAAMRVLERRIDNAPLDRLETERGWRLGWERRVHGYASVGEELRRLGN